MARDPEMYRRLFETVQQLNEALMKTHMHPNYRHVWEHYQNSGLTYRGPSYFAELRALRAFMRDNPLPPLVVTPDDTCPQDDTRPVPVLSEDYEPPVAAQE